MNIIILIILHQIMNGIILSIKGLFECTMILIYTLTIHSVVLINCMTLFLYFGIILEKYMINFVINKKKYYYIELISNNELLIEILIVWCMIYIICFIHKKIHKMNNTFLKNMFDKF